MFFSSGIFNAINLRTICNSNLLSAYNSLVSCVFILFTASKKLTHIVSLVAIFTNCVSLYSGTYFGSLYSYPFLFIRQYMQNQSDRKKNNFTMKCIRESDMATTFTISRSIFLWDIFLAILDLHVCQILLYPSQTRCRRLCFFSTNCL